MDIRHGKVVTLREKLPPINCITFYAFIHKRSFDKLKTLYLHYHGVYGHKAYQVGDIPQGAPIH